MHLHRAQLEYELREKLILLRQRLLEAGDNDRALWDLAAGLGVGLRHPVPARPDGAGRRAPQSKREAIQILATRIQFEPSAFLQLLDIREHKADRKQFDAKDVFTRYLAAVQHVTAAVDTMLDTSGTGSDETESDRFCDFLIQEESMGKVRNRDRHSGADCVRRLRTICRRPQHAGDQE